MYLNKTYQRVKDYIIKYLNNLYSHVDVVTTKYSKHAIEIAKNSCGVYKYLIISGGDGTFSEIINGIAEQEKKPIVGYIPSGTINDISRSLKIPLNYKKALQVIKNNKIFSHDLFKANNNYGIYVCGTGAFTNTSYITKHKTKKVLGKLAYFLQCIKQIFTVKDFRLRLTDENGNVTAGKYIMMLACNSKSLAGFKINKTANLNDGKVDVILIKRNNYFTNYFSSIFIILKMFLFGIKSLKKNKNVTILNLNSFNVCLSKSLYVNIDGEKTFKGNFNFQTIENGINIIIP